MRTLLLPISISNLATSTPALCTPPSTHAARSTAWSPSRG
jgi:hypothetical protein